jgi:hypothetical protein
MGFLRLKDSANADDQHPMLRLAATDDYVSAIRKMGSGSFFRWH